MKAVLSTDLAIVLQALKRNDDAINIYKKAIELFKFHKDWKSLFRAMNNLGVVYFDLKKYTDAESLFNDVLLQSKILNNLQFETISYLNLADIHSKRGEWKKAIFHAEKAIQIAGNNHKWNLIANGKIITAKCLFAQGEFDHALDLLENLLEEPQANENQLLRQEIQAWIIHFNIHLHFDKVPDLLEKWALPYPEMHEILIRELFFFYYFNHSYLKAGQMAKRLPDNSIFHAFLDSEPAFIEKRLKELKIQNENDSYLYYLTWLIQTDLIDSNSSEMNDFKDDIKLFDYKPAEACCNKSGKQADFSLFFRISDIIETTDDPLEMISLLMKELFPLYHFKRYIYFENKSGIFSPSLLIDHYGREIDPNKIWFSQSIIKQICTKQGLIYDAFILNTTQFNTSSSIIGMGISSVLAWPVMINNEITGIIYADSNEQRNLSDKQLKLAETMFKMLNQHFEKIALKSERAERIQMTTLNEEMNSNWKIIGNSKMMEDVFNKIRMVAAYNVNVLITGPTGSGKELVSRAIHQLYTERNPVSKNAPFVAVNCAAIPEQLLESELFGYKKGAFTGAVSDQKGKILEANYGTIFLDEIGEMPLILQAKLLRVIQDKEVTPLGTSISIPVTVRIIAATNKNLEDLVNQNLFRADLFYRLKVMSIPIPALEERREDIPLLVMHFLKKFNQKFNKNINGIHPKTMHYLQFKEWKGNIRELENEIERAVLMCNKDFLSMDDLLEENQTDNMAGFSQLPVKWAEYKEYKQKITEELDYKYASQLLENAEGNISLASKMGNLDRVQIYRLLKSKNTEK
ncbi:MAG: sigma 54-interacting transcriptional regulator [Candidatus Cloacimonetes bacterium]|nr:sigma 54-interacting transcriptional regulator [Candidatus Cloacimonadota bacterium]